MKKEIICKICGHKKAAIIESNGQFICADCLIKMGKDAKAAVKNIDNPSVMTNDIWTPKRFKQLLDDYVIGQEIAKKKISVAFFNHLMRLKHLDEHGDDQDFIPLEKSNILMVGPTGSGKTLMLKTLAKNLNMPLAIQDCTNLTAAGYVGEDVENCLRKLIEAADGDVKAAERGIVFLDEVDKIGRKGENVSITRDVSGESVQQALLKLVEGTVAEVPEKGVRKNPNESCTKIDTSNILFIIGGSFEGIEKIIAKRINGKTGMGFGATIVDTSKKSINDYITKVNTEDLRKFGMLPEFLGRFPIIAPLKELTENELLRILTEPKNAIVKQYKILFKECNKNITFDDESLHAIAKKAIANKTGARGLRTIIEDLLLDDMFNIEDLNENLVLDSTCKLKAV